MEYLMIVPQVISIKNETEVFRENENLQFTMDLIHLALHLAAHY